MTTDEELAELVIKFVRAQRPLGPECARVLFENMDKLYEESGPPEPVYIKPDA